jgi:nuclear protein localization protein 4 homolog
MRNPADGEDKTPVIVAGKDVGELDNDYWLLAVKILDHSGPLLTSFPPENRLVPQVCSPSSR